MLTKFHGIPRPPKAFNLFYLDHNESLLSSVSSKLKSIREVGKLHLSTRAIYFQPQQDRLPIVKFKLTHSDFQYSCNPNIIDRPESKRRTSPRGKQSLHSSIETKLVLVLSVKEFFVITRNPISPAFAQCVQETFAFEMSKKELTRVVTELEMVTRYPSDESVVDILYGIRYKELISMVKNSQDFDADDLLLHYGVRRVLPEAHQMGAFILTRSSFHFYCLINARPNAPLHINFKNIVTVLKYTHLHAPVGICVYCYSMSHPLLFLFERPEQRENIYSFLLNKVKFTEINKEKMTKKWEEGLISNFEYLVFLNNIASRSTLDLSQYPVFPWVISNYSNPELDLSRPMNFRDLSKPMGALNSARLSQLQAKNKSFLYESHYSNPIIVSTYLLRTIPEFLLRYQNCVFGLPEKIFSSVESSYWYSFHSLGDFKEVIPEFFECCEFLINVEGAEIRNAETIPNVKIPTWAQDYQDFVDINRQALESDIVSENLHHWIDLIFGCKQRDHNNTYFEEAYEISEDLPPFQREAYLLIAREFGVCPEQVFTEPHPQKKFLKGHKLNNDSTSNTPSRLITKVAMLEHELEVIQSNHSRELEAQEDRLKAKINEQKKEYERVHKRFKDKITRLEKEESKSKANNSTPPRNSQLFTEDLFDSFR